MEIRDQIGEPTMAKIVTDYIDDADLRRLQQDGDAAAARLCEPKVERWNWLRTFWRAYRVNRSLVGTLRFMVSR